MSSRVECVTVKIADFTVDILINDGGDLMLCVDERNAGRTVDILVDHDLNVIADGRKAV